MKSFSREVDRIMMPSTFRWNAKGASDRDKEIMKYAPLVMKVVNEYSRNEDRIGILNKHDLIQQAFVGLVEGYDAIHRSKGTVNTKYLELRINTSIKRLIQSSSTGVAIPEYQIAKTKAEQAVDKLFGYWLHSFRITDLELFEKTYGSYMKYMQRQDSYDNEILEEQLLDGMLRLSERERDILKYSYGIGLPKQSMKQISSMLKMSLRTVERTKRKSIDKLRIILNKEDFNYYY